MLAPFSTFSCVQGPALLSLSRTVVRLRPQEETESARWKKKGDDDGCEAGQTPRIDPSGKGKKGDGWQPASESMYCSSSSPEMQ